MLVMLMPPGMFKRDCFSTALLIVDECADISLGSKVIWNSFLLHYSAFNVKYIN